MQSPSERSTTLLLERPGGEVWPEPAVVTTVGLWQDGDDGRTVAAAAGPAPEREPVLASPGLALLAAVSILEGYRWVGAIPSGDSRLSTLASGRGGAIAFAALATAAVLLLTRSGRGGRRPLPQRLARLATAVVIASSVAMLAATGTAAKDAIGVSDLLLASALAGVLIAGERSRRAGRLATTPAQGGSATGALPVA